MDGTCLDIIIETREFCWKIGKTLVDRPRYRGPPFLPGVVLYIICV